MAKVIILVGPPGAGKSVQAELLARDGWQHLSTGHLLRTRRPDLMAKMAEGGLMSDREVQELLSEAVAETPAVQSIVLDGFPRTVEQAKWLDGRTEAWGRQFAGLIELHVDGDVTIQRLMLRGRHDDDEAVMRRRLEVYERETKPVIDYYAAEGKLRRVDGVGTVEEVHERVTGVLK